MRQVRRRYHRDIGIPDNIALVPPRRILSWTVHALSALIQDSTELPPNELSDDAQCVEVTCNQDGSVWRWVFRQAFTPYQDILLVLQPNGEVVTCWTNDITDTHRTLDTSLYDRPTILAQPRPGFTNTARLVHGRRA